MIDSLTITVKTEKRHIAYASFIIEAYDGMGVVRTADPESGLLEVLVAPDMRGDFMKLAEALAGEMPFKVIPA
ncbi:MAG: DUF4911 domain-containing protein [Nitrospirota bacterium]